VCVCVCVCVCVLTDQCYSMTPLIDQELEKIDRYCNCCFVEVLFYVVENFFYLKTYVQMASSCLMQLCMNCFIHSGACLTFLSLKEVLLQV